MLAQVPRIQLNDQIWKSIPSRAELSAGDEGSYFAPVGFVSPSVGSRRNYVRLHMRERGLVVRGEHYHAVYTKDASPKGIAFLSPVQIFPAERIRLLLNRYQPIDLELRRCRRLGPKCYECGTVFADGVIPPALFAYFVHSHSRRH